MTGANRILWYNLICNRAEAVLVAVINPHWLLQWMSHQRDWEFKAEQWRNLAYQRISGAQVLVRWTIMLCNPEAFHQSAYQTNPLTPQLALAAQTTLKNLWIMACSSALTFSSISLNQLRICLGLCFSFALKAQQLKWLVKAHFYLVANVWQSPTHLDS